MEMVKGPDFDEAERLVCAHYSDKAMDIFRERYCLKDEPIPRAMWRVAITVARGDEAMAMRYFHGLLLPNGFMPNTPTWTGAGTRLNQLAACFVLPIEDDMESIFNTLRDAALIQRSGGGVGFNFGHLRPEDALVKSSGGRSSGPISFLTAYDAVFQTIAQGSALSPHNSVSGLTNPYPHGASGSRRGACMGILPVDHPDIESFIRCKKQEGRITNFNLSVSITDAFMEAVMAGGPWGLKDPETDEVVQEISAADLFSDIIDSTWTNGEPGVLFIDTINKCNPAPEAFHIEATNPCVTGDSVVQTIDGPRYVRDLVGVPFCTVEGDSVQEGFFATRMVTDLVRVTTVMGYSITCTANHLLHTVLGWVEAEKLAPGSDDMMLLAGSPCVDNQDGANRLTPDEEKMDEKVGWALASGIYTDDYSEEFCRRDLDGADVAASVCIVRNCWMYSGRPQGTLMVGKCAEATARAMHLCLLRMGLVTTMAYSDDIWEYAPAVRSSVAFQCIVCCQRDMTESVRVAVSNARKVFALSRMATDTVARVDRLAVPETTVYDATCRAPTQHILHTDGFLSHNCGEIPLSAYESCCLGSINLRNHVGDDGRIDWRRLEASVMLGVRFLDDVIDANGFVPSVPKLQEMARTTRRIGLGIMGLADMFFGLGVRYGSMESISVASQVMEFIRYTAMRESVALSRERGPFPAYDRTKYASDTWVTPARLDTERLFGEPYAEHPIGRPALDWEGLRAGVRRDGLRNIATTAVAPTGTLSLASGVSGFGCEPVFGLVHRRRIISRHDGQVRYQTMMVPELSRALSAAGLSDGQIDAAMERIKTTSTCWGIEGVPKSIGDVFVCAADVTVKEHVMMQAALQCFVDGAISKTVNMPEGSTRADVRETFLTAWRAGCKGICVYRSGSRVTEVLSTGSK